MEHAWGYDESMHAELPAARMAVALKSLDGAAFFETIHDCQQYPFAYPLLLGGVQLCTGVSEHVCRVVGRLLCALGCFGLFLLAAECARRMGAAGSRLGLAPWLALAFGALSPLAVHYSGTLFLETPFCVVAIFTLRAWLRRERDSEQRVRILRELAAGAWLSLAFFTKFNYGVLLWLGLGSHLLFETVRDRRLGMRSALDRLACVAVVPALALAWWFLLPLPEGAERAAAHREAFAAFLQGNQGFARTPWAYRGIHWAIALTYTPRVLLLLLAGALASMRYLRKPPVQVLWLVLLATGIPVSLHDFQLDRFLLPVAVPLWALAALGLGGLLPTGARARACVLVVLVPAVFLFPRFDGEAFFDRFGPSVPPEHLDYRNNELLVWMRDLAPGRRLETNGLLRTEVKRLVDLIDDEVRPGERVMWLGALTNFSPAALQLALYQRRGDRAHFLREARRKILITDAGAVDPGWSEQQLVDFAAGFDVVFSTRPLDLRGQPGWNFLERYRELLFGRSDWIAREIGTLEIAKPPPNEELVHVQVHAARRR
jgi:hypothetical protein